MPAGHAARTPFAVPAIPGASLPTVASSRPNQRVREVIRLAALMSAALAATIGSAQAQVGYTGVVNDFAPPIRPEYDLAIEHDALGNGFAVWSTDTTVWAAHRAPGARAWSDPVVLHNPSGPSSEPESLDIAVDDQGNAVLVWWRHQPTAPQVIGGVVEHAYFHAGSNLWTQAAFVPGAVNALYSPVVMDRLRRVTVMWYESVLDVTFLLKAAHYDPGRVPSSWSSARTIGGSGYNAGSGGERLVVDGDGNITAGWHYLNTTSARYSIVAARYSPVSDTWSDDVILELGDGFASNPFFAVDTDGNVNAVWDRGNVRDVRFARFDKAVNGWSLPITIPGSSSAERGRVATLPGGDAMVMWDGRGDIGVVAVTRYLLPTATWTTPVAVSGPVRDPDAGDLETDSSGNAFAVWNCFDGVQEVAQAARYNFATGAWSPARDLGPLGDDGEHVQVALNAAGNAIFGWEFEEESTDINKVQWTERLAVPAAPTITSVSSGSQSLLVAFTPPLTTEPGFAPTQYEYQLTNVAHLGWIGGTPLFTSSPITIGSLTDGTTYTVRIRALNAAGAGLPSSEMVGTPGQGLLAPTSLRVVSISGNTVTLGWNYHAGSVPPIGFELEGGLRPGETLGTIQTGSTATTFTFTAPTGAFYVRARAIGAGTRSGPSNEIRIFVNVPAPPEAPRELAGTATLFDVHLTWRRPDSAIDSYILGVTGPVAGSWPLPGQAESFSYSGVPAGTYTFTLRAQNATGVSDPSNPVTLVFPGGCAVPNAPYGLVSQVVRQTVTLFWSRPVGGGPPSRYEIEAGALPWQTSLVWTMGSTSTIFTTTGVPIGTYYVRVRAANACGRSEPTDAIKVDVPLTVP